MCTALGFCPEVDGISFGRLSLPPECRLACLQRDAGSPFVRPPKTFFLPARQQTNMATVTIANKSYKLRPLLLCVFHLLSHAEYLPQAFSNTTQRHDSNPPPPALPPPLPHRLSFVCQSIPMHSESNQVFYYSVFHPLVFCLLLLLLLSSLSRGVDCECVGGWVCIFPQVLPEPARSQASRVTRCFWPSVT